MTNALSHLPAILYISAWIVGAGLGLLIALLLLLWAVMVIWR